MGRQRYSQEYKEQALNAIRKGGRSLKDIAKALGVNYWTIREWNRELAATPEEDKRVKAGEREELRRLRRENEDVRMEIAILKKYAAILSKDQP